MNEEELKNPVLLRDHTVSNIGALSHQGLCNSLFQFLLSRENVGVLRVRSGSRQTHKEALRE